MPEFKQPNLREVLCHSYHIIYRLRRDEQRIDIVRFWHAARGFPRIPGRGLNPPDAICRRAFAFGVRRQVGALKAVTCHRSPIRSNP